MKTSELQKICSGFTMETNNPSYNHELFMFESLAHAQTIAKLYDLSDDDEYKVREFVLNEIRTEFWNALVETSGKAQFRKLNEHQYEDFGVALRKRLNPIQALIAGAEEEYDREIKGIYGFFSSGFRRYDED